MGKVLGWKIEKLYLMKSIKNLIVSFANAHSTIRFLIIYFLILSDEILLRKIDGFKFAIYNKITKHLYRINISIFLILL
jgi:hypothetical protein